MAALVVERGRHIWVWARTDRDAPTEEEICDTAANMMARVFGETPTSLISVELEDGARRYSVGPMRPLDVAVMSRRPGPTEVEHIDRVSFEDQPTPFAVRASNVIFVGCDFDWRGPDFRIEDWPRRKVNVFGFPVDEPMELDWLLLDAYVEGESTRDDVPLSDLLGRQLRPVFGGLGMLAVIVGLVWLSGDRRE